MPSAKEWKKRVADWKRSGLTGPQFAASGGFSAQQLHNWASKFGVKVGRAKRRPKTVGAVRFLRVVPQRPAVPASIPPPALQVRVGKACVEVRYGFDEATLKRVVAVLGSVSEEAR
jgi:hypothetical protein